jgi:carboxymethylenebutenolidase
MSFPRVFAAACAALSLVACHRQPPMDEHMAHMSAGDLALPAIPASNQQGDMSLPASSIHSAARLASSPRHGEWVKVAWEPGSKDSLMAYVVYPSTNNPKSPVVVVVHEIYGLSTWVRAVADQAAADGFIAIAPDLTSRVRGGPSMDSLTTDSASKLTRPLPAAERNKGIDAVARYAMSQPAAATRYGVIGFCWGGGTVWMHAVNGGIPGYSGGVAFYGLPYMNGAVPNGDSLAKVNKPVMMYNGAKDTRTGTPMPAVDSAMKALGKSYYGKNFAGAIHGFARAQDDPRQPRAQETEADVQAEEKANLAAIKEAWPQTVDFLKKNLGMGMK